MLAALVDTASEGLALLDDNACYLWVNPAGGRILGIDAAELVATPAVLAPDAGTNVVRWCRPASQRERELEVRTLAVTAGGRATTAVAFRDVTELRQQQRRSIAFAAAAASVADGGSLRGTLETICAEVVRTTDLAGAQILLLDPTAGCGCTGPRRPRRGPMTFRCAWRRRGSAELG